MWNTSATWDPAQNGPIGCILLELDVKSVSGWGDGQVLFLLVVQDGKYYVADGEVTGSQTDWHTVVGGPATELTFYEIVGANQYDTSSHPDFGPEGSPMHFGFATANSNSDYYTQKYDNWSLFITYCPGDLDGDGCVDQADLGILLADWGCTGGNCPGDCDNDGDTDQADLGILLAHWGEGCS
jgi:hypothetical protein